MNSKRTLKCDQLQFHKWLVTITQPCRRYLSFRTPERTPNTSISWNCSALLNKGRQKLASSGSYFLGLTCVHHSLCCTVSCLTVQIGWFLEICRSAAIEYFFCHNTYSCSKMKCSHSRYHVYFLFIETLPDRRNVIHNKFILVCVCDVSPN